MKQITILASTHSEIAGSVKHNCADCEKEVVVSPETFKSAFEQSEQLKLGIEYCCIECMIKRLEKSPEKVTFIPVSEGQFEEIKSKL